MACPSPTYTGTDLKAVDWVNWSGRFRGRVNDFFEPNSLADLINVVQRASQQGRRLHVVGSGWAYEDLAFTSDWMVSLARLNKALGSVTGTALNAQWSAPGADPLFHIEAGATIADLNDALAAAGLAMPTLGGNVGQAVAGAISTGTHGGDPTQPPLADAVMAMHLVTQDGRELWIERASAPITDDLKLANALPCKDAEILRDDGVFDALLVACGRFGVIYSYVLRVRPAFRLAEWTTQIPRVVLTTSLRDGVTNGTFLTPLLSILPVPPAALGALNVPNPVGLQVVFDTNNLNWCWVTRRWPTNDPTDLAATSGPNALCQAGAAGVLAAATAVLSPFVGAPFYGIAVSGEMVALQGNLVANPSMTAGEMLALVMSAFWRLGLGWAIPQLSGVQFGQQFQASSTTGKRGPSAAILSASRAESRQTCFRADSIEPIFDAHAPAFIDYLETILNAAVNRRQAGYVSLRWSRASRATMSMHKIASGHGVAVEVTSLRNLPDNAWWFALLESEAISRGGRPHWGQINTLNGAQTSLLYGPDLPAWRMYLAGVVGTAPTFSNAFTAQRELEPPAVAVAPITGSKAGDIIAAATPRLIFRPIDPASRWVRPT
jgi:hypothetical protein